MRVRADDADRRAAPAGRAMTLAGPRYQIRSVAGRMPGTRAIPASRIGPGPSRRACRRRGRSDPSAGRRPRWTPKRRERWTHEDSPCRAGVVAAVGVGLWSMAAAPAARAQVKLEYKFPEGETLTYKTTIEDEPGHDDHGDGDPDRGRADDRHVAGDRQAGRRREPAGPAEGRVDPHRDVAAGRHADHLRLEGARRQDRATTSSRSWATSSSSPRRPTYTVVLDGKNKVKAIEGAEKLQEKAEKLNPDGARLDASALLGRQAQGRVRAVARQLARRPGPSGRALGADRDHGGRRPGRPWSSARSTSTPAPRRRGTRPSTRSPSRRST